MEWVLFTMRNIISTLDVYHSFNLGGQYIFAT